MTRTKLYALAAAAAFAAPVVSRGGITINEFQYDAPGTNPDKRFFEFKSSTGGVETLSGLTLVALEGDGGAAGVIDFFHTFAATDATGTNGLALLRDGTATIAPAPAAATTVITDAYAYNENTTVTYLLVSGFTGAVNNDLDTNNDGTLDSTPWTSVLSAYGIRDDAAADKLYATALGGKDFDEADAPFNAADIAGVVVLPDGTAVAVGTTGDNTAGYTVNRSSTPLTAGYQLTPGSANPAVPEPATLSLLGLGLAGGLGRRRRRHA